MRGETVGHYLIGEQLGAGGMGVVYKARDLRLERDVAIKVVRPEAASATFQAAFLREARLASSLNHPGIVTVYDIVSHGGMECIVMELVAGEPLGGAIPATGFGVERGLRLAIAIAEALAAAHAAGVIHRDLKPANILVRAGDQIKILDFGLAKLVDPGNREEAATDAASLFSDHLVGTLGFMAPEQARGEVVDQRADIFALGAIFYQMFTGRRAFEANNAGALLHAVQSRHPAALREHCPEAPAALEALLQRAMAKEAGARVATMTELVAALQAIAAGRAPVVAAPGLAPPTPGSAKTSIAVLAFRSLSPDPDDVYLASGLAAEISSALTGVPGLRIASQHAAFRLGESGADPLEAAAHLDVRYIVAGSLRRAGTRVRVSAELVDARARRLVWSHNYDRDLTDIFAVQENISRAIVSALGGELIRATSDFAHRTPTSNLDAWGLVRKAYHLWNYEFSLGGVAQALDLLRRAIALDPGYAVAHALLALYLNTTVISRISADLEADQAEALAAAALACQLSPEDAQVLECAALVWQHTGQYEKAVTCLKRAVRQAPFDLVAWGYLAFAYACAGNRQEVAEAVAILTRLVGDAPDHPSRAFWHQFSTIAFLRLENYRAAAEHGRLAVEMQPGFVFNQVFCAEALCRLDASLIPEARAMLATIPTYNPRFTLAVFEDVALKSCRSAESVERLCGRIRSLGLFI